MVGVVNGLVDESDDESEESESEADDIYRGRAVPVPGSGVEVGVSRRDIS